MGDDPPVSVSPAPPSSPLLDEFQAFVTRVKQLHMSRSADADCEQNLSHDKIRRRYENAAVGKATIAPVDNNALLKPSQTPPPMAKSLDDQQLQRQGTRFFNPALDDIEMEQAVEGEEEVVVKKEELNVKSILRGETKDMKKNIQVMVGIDEDLKMILEMDPEIVDLGGVEKNTAEPKVMGLPPLSGR